MKVTRKVGRSKHSRRSSISRRRLRNKKNSKNKSSYKKRYGKTHRGGCWSVAKKGGARSRKYGHKRGKRFHKGGMPDDCYKKLTSSGNISLKYKKNVFVSTSETKPFMVEVYGVDKDKSSRIDCSYESSAKIVLTRKTPDNPLVVTMEFSYMPIPGIMNDILSNGSGDNNSKYSFAFPENTDSFKQFFKKIDENITEIKNAKEQTAKKEKEEREKQEKEEMEKARQTFRDVQAKYKDMKSDTYSGDYSELSVNLFPYMKPEDKEELLIAKNKGPDDELEVIVNFKEFKEKQERLADSTKEAIINDSSLDETTKESKKSQVDKLLKEIIDTQKKLMLAVYFMDNAFKGDYGSKVYDEETQKQFQNPFIDEFSIARSYDGRNMYTSVQANIQKMKDLATGITPANSDS